MEDTPTNIDELKKAAADRFSYKNRLAAIDALGAHKCQQSKDILWRLMIQDKVYAVQEAAFSKLQAFGESVKLPRKQKGHLVKDINKKFGRVLAAANGTYDESAFNSLFQQLYPEEFDIYSFEKGRSFDKWVANVLSSLHKAGA